MSSFTVGNARQYDKPVSAKALFENARFVEARRELEETLLVAPKHAPALPRSIRSIRVATVREAIDRIGLSGE